MFIVVAYRLITPSKHHLYRNPWVKFKFCWLNSYQSRNNHDHWNEPCSCPLLKKGQITPIWFTEVQAHLYGESKVCCQGRYLGMQSHYPSLLGFSRAYAPVSTHLTCQKRIQKNLFSYSNWSNYTCHFLTWLMGYLPWIGYLVHFDQKIIQQCFHSFEYVSD